MGDLALLPARLLLDNGISQANFCELTPNLRVRKLGARSYQQEITAREVDIEHATATQAESPKRSRQENNRPDLSGPPLAQKVEALGLDQMKHRNSLDKVKLDRPRKDVARH